MNLNFGNGAIGLLNPRVRRQKFGIGSFLVFFIIGAAFTVIGFGVFQATKVDPSWTRVQGQVVDVHTSIDTGTSANSGTTYSPIVSYKVDGQTYKVSSSISTSSYPTVGSPRQVAYDPQMPGKSKVVEGGSTKAILLIFPVVGIFFILIAIILLVRSLRRNKDISNLQRTGLKLPGIITGIRNSSVSTNNNLPSYKVVVSATDLNGAVQEYVSDSLTGIGGLLMTDFSSNPVPIDVYINPSDPKDYYVDVSDVPNLTPDRIKQLIGQAVSGQTPPVQPFTAPTQSVQPTQPTQPSQQSTPPTPPINPVQ